MNELEKKIAELLGKRTVPQTYSRAVADKYELKEDSDETAITEAVEKFTGFYRTYIQPEVDRRTDGAIKTFRDKHGLDENGKPIEDPEKPKPPKAPAPKEDVPKPDGMSEEMKTFLETQTAIIKDLQTQVVELSSGQKRSTMQEQAKSLFGKSESLKKLKPSVQERWLKRLDFESETSIEDQIAELESEANEFLDSVKEEFINDDLNSYQPRMPKSSKPEDYLKIMNGDAEDGEEPGVQKVEFPK